jgi:replicative DNA helicase
MSDAVLLNGLPASADAERFVLGSLLADWEHYAPAALLLKPDDFTSERNRRVMGAIRGLATANQHVDRLTVFNAMQQRTPLSELIAFEDGLPLLPNIDAYVGILKRQAEARRLVYLGQALMDRALDPSEDPQRVREWAQAALADATGQRDERAELLSPPEIVAHAGGLDSMFGVKQSGRGILTPWIRLNEYTTGFHAGELIVLAANTGMGKSSAAMQIAMHAAQHGHGAVVFSLEMSRENLIGRMVCQIARVDGHRQRSGKLSAEDRYEIMKAVRSLEEIPLWIAEHGARNEPAMRMAIRNHRAKHPIKIAIVDYLQLMKALARHHGRHEELSEITRSLKLMAIEEDLVVVLLSQLSRENMRKPARPPELSDLRESGSIEENADAVFFLWRPEMVHRERDELRGLAEMIVKKQRNGPTGVIRLTWLGHLTKFENAANDCEEM